nr:hypothetical protein [Actinomycetota bacterium]
RLQPTLPGVEETATPSAGIVEPGMPSAGIGEPGTPAGSGELGTPAGAAVTSTTPVGGGGRTTPSAPGASPTARSATGPIARSEQRDAPYCYQCGNAMQRSGSCYVCASCGSTSGCS